MRKREIIRQFVVPLEIYDLNLPKSICESLAGDMPAPDKDTVWGLDVIFDKGAYQKAEFYQYPIAKEHKGSQPKTQQDKRKQVVYDVLSEQLDKVVAEMENLGLRFGRTAIIGEETNANRVQIILYKTEPAAPPKRKKQEVFRVSSIVPDRPHLTEQATKVFAEILLNQIREENWKEIAKQNHVPNWVAAGDLFLEIAKSLYPEAGDTEETKSKLIRDAMIECDWPLRMRSRTKHDPAESITEETKLDCPEYLLFCLTGGGSWDMKKIEGLQAAQQFMVKHGYRSKRIKSIVVLHHGKTVPYTLLGETGEGLVFITPEEAPEYQKIHVCWNKGK